MTTLPDPRYARYIYEFEVEITDPSEAVIFNLAPTMTAEGELGMTAPQPDQAELALAISRTISEALHSAKDRGFKWKSGNILPRSRDELGRYHEFTFPPMPGRDENGDLIEWPSMGGPEI